MRNRLFPLTAFPFLAIVLGGCGGGSPQQESRAPIELARPSAVAGRANVVGGDGSPATADSVPVSVPVSVKVSASQDSIPSSEITGYTVYRQPDGSSSESILLITQQGTGPVFIYDNSLSVGSRADYKIVLNYTTGQDADGMPVLKSKTLQLTNYVTQIEPTENASITSAGTGIVSVPATLGADDYVMDVSAAPDFNRKQRFTPSSKGPYTAHADAPRHGTTVTFGAIDVAQAFPGTAALYLRIGARDSRNGMGSDNPYVFTDPQQFPAL